MAKSDRMIYQVDETRNKILEAAEKLFIEKGLYDTRMLDIAAEVDLSRTSLYRYYTDKLELSLSIVKICIRRINSIEDQRTYEALKDGLGKVEYLLKSRWLSPGLSDTYRFLAEFDSYYSGSRIPESFREKMENLLLPDENDKMLKAIEEGQRDHSVTNSCDSRLLKEIIENGIRSLHNRLILRGAVMIDVDRNDLEIIMDEYLKILLKGIKK